MSAFGGKADMMWTRRNAIYAPRRVMED